MVVALGGTEDVFAVGVAFGDVIVGTGGGVDWLMAYGLWLMEERSLVEEFGGIGGGIVLFAESGDTAVFLYSI